MNQLQDAKKRYEEIPIPDDLSVKVQEAIERSSQKRRENSRIIRAGYRRFLSRSLGTAAAAMIVFTTLLNTSTAFADTVSGLPVVGTVARLLTFRSYEKNEDDLKISVEIPSVEMIAEDTNGLEDSVNQEILERCQAYADEAVSRAEAYREAFLATGGTEEEWAAHNIQIRVWYELKSQSEDYLSFVVKGTENWSSAYNRACYYNLDLKNGTMVTLKDLLGDDYIQQADESIKKQMEERAAAENISFLSPEEGGFTGITAETLFYINESGNPVIVFEKYEIAPGSAGEIYFEIER